MSTLKALRLRIAGVKSTQKITRAMKMVAASKLLKSQEQKERTKAYANKMYDVITHLTDSISSNSDVSPLLTGNGKDNSYLLVAVGSDRGLCGGFNSNVVKNLKKKIRLLESNGKSYKIICMGKRVYDQIKATYHDKVLEVISGFSNKKIVYEDGAEIASKIIDLFNDNSFDICTFIYSEFQNAAKHDTHWRQLIPMNEELWLQRQHEEELLSPSEAVKQVAQNMVYEYEPSENKILNQIIPLNLGLQIYYILLESVASEYGARMTAMESATNNASDMINELTLLYNRSRQATVTRELIEIISSAEAL